MPMTIDQALELLQANIWTALGASAVLGVIVGLFLRGASVKAKLRRAGVDRDVALTELDQVKGELDALFAAQRKQREGAEPPETGTEDHVAALQERDDRISALTEELNGLRREADSAAAGSGTANGVADAEASGLNERNAWLEARVAALEADLEKVEPEQGQGNAEADQELARLRWRNRYLEGRLAYFEEGPIGSTDGSSEVGQAETVPEPSEEVDETTGSPTGAPSTPVLVVSDAQKPEEVSADPLPEEAAPSGEDSKAEEAAEADEAEEAVEALEADQAPGEVEADTPTAEVDEVSAEEGGAAEEDETVHPSEVMLQQIESAQSGTEAIEPPVMDKPKGDLDNLTAISGIGPRIEEVLHELGIWSYQQIADWTPEHVAWVEQHLAFQGRIGREAWIEQAKTLRT